MPIARRKVLVLPVAAAAAAAVAYPLLSGQANADVTPTPRRTSPPFQPPRPNAPGRRLADAALAEPIDRAYRYLDVVQDGYLSGDEPRLLQSYNNESGLMTTGFVYDNALAALAYLANPAAPNVRRARLIGDALLWAQANDEKYTDGRLRQAYAVGPMTFYGGSPSYPGLEREDGKAAHLDPYGFSGSSTGDMAWASLALAQLFAQTHDDKYLTGALALGEWIAGKKCEFAYGGYHGGLQADGKTPQTWASTEHNIDAYALFVLLAKLTHDRQWLTRAEVAAKFVAKMWNADGGHFWTGTLGAVPGDDPNLLNKVVIPEDVHTWAALGMRDRRYNPGLDWVADNLWNTDGDAAGSELPDGTMISGVTFSDLSKTITENVSGAEVPNNRDAVWLEGNGHLALALLKRGDHGDEALACRLLRETVVAQNEVGAGQTVGRTTDPKDGQLSDPGAGGTWTGNELPPKSGIVAASSAFDTGFSFGYFQRQHVGATSWFLMAGQRFNPYR